MASPQLVGYVSELPGPGAYCTKTVMGRSILLTRTADGSVKAFDNVCLHRQSQVATGCGTAKRFTCPYHAWTYDNTGRLVGLPGPRGLPDVARQVRRSDRTAGHRIRRIPLGGTGSRSRPRRRRTPGTAGRRARLVGHRAVVSAGREGARLPDQLEVGRRHLRGELPFRHRAPADLCHHRPQQLHGIRRVRTAPPVDLPAQHDPRTGRRSRGAVGSVPQHGRDLRAVPQHRDVGDDRQRRAVPDLPRRPTG